ncbi:MAG: N-acetylmuramoyl-L-alanine amidase [Archangiaceae bacterium]|nr:N-acetylmuramoyl-L-alanine amidase [Archangiaceae bacterium]
MDDTGALAGKTIYLSPGHGFTWEAGLSGWRTQRGTTHQIVEDLVSTETVSQYLLPMLVNAGARVVTVREIDLSPAMVVVDNAGAGYLEAGPDAGFSDSTLAGWGKPPAIITGATNPFTLGTNRLMDAAATATASATYSANLPAAGEYNVYVSYTEFTARVTDAHYLVKHAGGESHFRVNQRRAGGTWVLLGRFYFKVNTPAVVQVLNDSASGVGNVSLDAVRFGGGMGLIDRGGGVSKRPRFEESARYHAQFSGAPATVYDYSDTDHNDDVGARSRFSAWVHEPGEDAIYLAWHTNAFDGTAVGTDVYVYGPNPPDGTYDFTGVAGSDKLAQHLHAELINDIRAAAGWNKPTWRDRGIHSAYFGELNPSHNNEMPAVLMEIAFHDNATDALSLKEPAFRYLATRAITQGVIRYFAEKDSKTPVFPPEPPTHLAAVGQGPDTVLVKWHAPATDAQGVGGQAATKYRVYSSADGLGWDDGVEVNGLSFTAAASDVRYWRVAAVNAGGESLPSATVAARAGAQRVLIVNAFDRLEASMAKTEDLSAYALGNVLRIFIKRLNDGSYARTHADALSPSTLGFDSATADALVAGEVTPAAYVALDFLAGRGHPAGAPLSAAEKMALSSGKPLFFSGTLDADAAFLSGTLHVAAVGGAVNARVDGADFLSGVDDLALDDGTRGAYLTGPTDALTGAGATVAARYDDAGTAAAVGVMGTVVTFGFPFETLVSRPARVEVMGRVMKYLGVLTELPDAGPIEPEPDAGTVDEPDAGEPDAGEPPRPVALPELTDALGAEAAVKHCGCGSAEASALLLLAIAYVRRRR